MSEPYQIDDPWCRHLPLLHRIVAGDARPEEFPRVSDSLELEEACAIWESLHYLLRYLLSWDDVSAGLAWWYAAGQPVADSPLLETVLQLWDREQQLDYYAAWAWTQGVPRSEQPSNLARDSAYHDLAWWEAFMRRPKPAGYNPYYGGGNTLHLGHSDWLGENEPASDPAELHFDESSRRAVLVVSSFGNWRRELSQSGNQLLPLAGDRSWHVELFDRQSGCLGLFRRSRETSRWFQGKHSIHIQGRARQTAEAGQ